MQDACHRIGMCEGFFARIERCAHQQRLRKCARARQRLWLIWQILQRGAQ